MSNAIMECTIADNSISNNGLVDNISGTARPYFAFAAVRKARNNKGFMKSSSTLSDLTTSTSSSLSTRSTNDVLFTRNSSLSDPTPRKSCLIIKTQHESLTLSCNDVRRRRRIDTSVRFSNVEFHFHGYILGDNPSITSGPPLSVEWESFYSPGTVSIEEYEASTVHDREYRKGTDLIVSEDIRYERLKNAGVAMKDIKRIEYECRMIRYSRENSMKAPEDVIPIRRRKKSFLHILFG